VQEASAIPPVTGVQARCSTSSRRYVRFRELRADGFVNLLSRSAITGTVGGAGDVAGGLQDVLPCARRIYMTPNRPAALDMSSRNGVTDNRD